MTPVRRAGALLAAASVVAACGTLPVTHGVHRVRSVAANAQQDTNVRLIPPPPQSDDSPATIVTGFLRAAASDVDRARLYLVANARWQPDSPVRVYSGALTATLVGTTPPTATRVADSTVRVTMTPVATLNPSGALVPTGRAPITLTFTLTDLPGTGWRIVDPPPGVALSVSDLTSRAQVPLTYFAPTGDVIVRAPVLLDPGDDLATTAVDALLAPPPAGLRTYVPHGTALNDVSVSSATVVVDLSPSAVKVSPADLPKLGAQLAATLLPLVPDATGVRIDVGGRPLEGSRQYNADDVDSYDPELSTAADRPLVVDAHGARVSALPSTATPDAGPATPAAFSDDGRRIAWVQARRVVTASVDTPTEVTPVTGAGSWLSLSWGRDGALWIVRGDVQSGGVFVVAPGSTSATPVAVPEGVAGAVSELRMARDGVNATLVAGGVLSGVTVGPGATGPTLLSAVPVARSVTKVLIATAPGRDGSLLAYGTFQGRRGLWRVATEISTELLTSTVPVASLRGPCANATVPTTLAAPGGDGTAPDVAVCGALLRTRDGDGTWSDAGAADGAAWPGG